MTDYYVYTHSLINKPPFYVGKGTLKRTRQLKRPHNKHHTNIVAKYGKENIIIRIMLCRSDSHAIALEVKLIAALRAGGVKLANATNGGDGASGRIATPEARANMSAAAKRRSPEAVAAGIARLAKANENRDPQLIAADIARLANFNRGKKQSPEHVAKTKAAQQGRKQTPEHIANAQAARKASQLLKKQALETQPRKLQ